jgi:hypothetical protein
MRGRWGPKEGQAAAAGARESGAGSLVFLSARGAGASGCSTTFATPALSLLSEPTSLECLNSPATPKGKESSSMHGELRVWHTDHQRATRLEHSRPRAAKGATVPALHPTPAHPAPVS